MNSNDVTFTIDSDGETTDALVWSPEADALALADGASGRAAHLAVRDALFARCGGGTGPIWSGRSPVTFTSPDGVVTIAGTSGREVYYLVAEALIAGTGSMVYATDYVLDVRAQRAAAAAGIKLTLKQARAARKG